MSQAIIELEEHKDTMEKNNKILRDANNSLQESVNRLLQLNEKQQTMLSTMNESLGKFYIQFTVNLFKIIIKY